MSKLLDDLLKLQNPTATLKKKGSLLDQLMALQTATPQPPTQLAPYANIPNPYNQPGGQQNAANIQPTQPVQPVQSTTPISTPTTPDRTNSYQNVYGTSSALQTAKTTGTVLPSTTTPQAINRATPDINQTLPPITPQTSTAQSTPVTTNRTQSPLDVLPAVAGAARASSDYLSLPISMAINATSKQPLSAKSIFDATHEMAKADIASGGTSSIDKAGQLYLKARGIKQGGNTPTIGDIVVLASLGAMNFVDPAIVVP